jgi:phage baseplate assembly protein V
MSAGDPYSDDSDRWYGVVPCIVVSSDDPNQLGRVQIKLPHMSDDTAGPWARVVALMAGNDRGTFFLPEQGDEVLVAFENGDPSRPYILGGLWNSSDAPPDTKKDKRIIKSHSGHIIRLDDTDGSEKVEIIDKTGNNSITFDTSSNTITIASAKDVSINAPQGTITLSAQTISIASSGDTKVTPSGSLTLQASGTTTVKGATVDIN